MDDCGLTLLLVAMNYALVVHHVVDGDNQAVTIPVKVALGPDFNLQVFYLDTCRASTRPAKLVVSTAKHWQLSEPDIVTLAHIGELCDLIHISQEVIEEEHGLLTLDAHVQSLDVE